MGQASQIDRHQNRPEDRQDKEIDRMGTIIDRWTGRRIKTEDRQIRKRRQEGHDTGRRHDPPPPTENLPL